MCWLYSPASGCSVPLGMESGLIKDHHITASSTASSWFAGPWSPSFARLNKQGTINAWQAKVPNFTLTLQVKMNSFTCIVTNRYDTECGCYCNTGSEWAANNLHTPVALKTLEKMWINSTHVPLVPSVCAHTILNLCFSHRSITTWTSGFRWNCPK